MPGASALPPLPPGTQRRPGAQPGTPADLQAQLAAARREIARITEQRDILKNVGHSLRTLPERYERVDAMKNNYPILTLCAQLSASLPGHFERRFRNGKTRPVMQTAKAVGITSYFAVRNNCVVAQKCKRRLKSAAVAGVLSVATNFTEE
jgi:hypothetical protein